MGILYVVATPIGNLEDITIRAKRILSTVPTIACEDTRHTGSLVRRLLEREAPKYISVRDWNEAESIDKILLELQNNDVALVSDAGTPLISDPGFKIVRAARAAGFVVCPIPGPCAVIAALSASGLPTNIFKFWGFLPKKWELEPNLTHVIYESPIRAQKTIEAIMAKYPNVQIVIAQELTKIYEKIENYKIGMKFKGEVTILENFSPSSEKKQANSSETK